MSTSLIDADFLLAIDVGSVTTRAALFDVVDGRYRYLASGSAPTTAYAPFNDISEGVRRALDHLQTVTGRVLVGPDEHLIIPSMTDGSGVDTVAATISVGAPLNVVAVGLLEDVSLESARRLVTTTYAWVIGSISLNDRRKNRRTDRCHFTPATGRHPGGGRHQWGCLPLGDQAGGSGGLSLLFVCPRSRSLKSSMPETRHLKEEVKGSLEKLGSLHFAANIRPDLETEQLEDAKYRLADLTRNVRIRHLGGCERPEFMVGTGLAPHCYGFWARDRIPQPGV